MTSTIIKNTQKPKRILVPLSPSRRLNQFFQDLFLQLVLFGLFAAVVLASLNDARKPAIYLYPTEDTQVQVQVDVRGFMYNDIPKYHDGWDVFATKEGVIDGQYDYLFYEAMLWTIDLPAEGWVVPFTELEAWLATTLPELGLNEKESRQFMEYWLAELPEANYYEVKLFDDAYVDTHLALNVEPTPDTIIRLLFHFRPVDELFTLPEPTIVTPKRTGFTVVEWGGILGK